MATILDFSAARYAVTGVVQSSSQITTPRKPTHIFAGQMWFLLTDQQCQDTEGFIHSLGVEKRQDTAKYTELHSITQDTVKEETSRAAATICPHLETVMT